MNGDQEIEEKIDQVEYSGLNVSNEPEQDSTVNLSIKEDETDHVLPKLNFAGDVEDFERKQDLFFEDRVRRIDYILVWPTPGNNKKSESREDVRDCFVKKLEEQGLEVEDEYKEGRNVQFTKIHAPYEVLVIHADTMKVRMPVNMPIKAVEPAGVWDRMFGWAGLFFSPFRLDNLKVPAIEKKFSYPFQKEKDYLFEKPSNLDDRFSRATRCQIVNYMLRRTEYSDGQQSEYKYGVKNLLADGTYLAAYPLHEGSFKKKSKMSIRKMLHENWASMWKWYKIQPLQHIRMYFGERIAFYFAWLGYYSYSLIVPSIVGIFVFLYGILSSKSDTVVQESCDTREPFVMCPKCYKRCGYWGYHRLCHYIFATHIVDNFATVVFAMFMSLWGTLFLEFWKREQATIQFLWDLKNFEEEEEPPRPEYLVNLENSKYKKKNLITGENEPYFPFWRHKIFVYFTSASLMIFLALVAVAVVIGVTVYRISLLAVLYMTDESPFVHRYAPLIVSISSAIINLILIFVLNFIYQKLAIRLTEWEGCRTQSEHDNSLRYKIYILQFVNYYSSLFYIAFFKGRFAGTPAEVSKYLGARLEECEGGSCLTELCIQLAIIFIGKQFIQNNLVEIFLPRIRRWAKFFWMMKRKKPKRLRAWERDFNKEDLGPLGLLDEYMEMMIQFGFVTLFVAAFPLAPFFALLNNLFELRADAHKFMSQYRRPMPARVKSIGIWYDILKVITRLAVITNACIIAFTSSMIKRQLYKMVYSPSGTLKGFLNNSLAYFDVKDFINDTAPLPHVIKSKYNNTKMCRYMDYREPPWSEEKYQYNQQHWHNVAAQFIFIVLFENVILILTTIAAYVIPDMSNRTKNLMRKEVMVINEVILKTELKRARNAQDFLSQYDFAKIASRSSNIEDIELRNTSFLKKRFLEGEDVFEEES